VKGGARTESLLQHELGDALRVAARAVLVLQLLQRAVLKHHLNHLRVALERAPARPPPTQFFECQPYDGKERFAATGSGQSS